MGLIDPTMIGNVAATGVFEIGDGPLLAVLMLALVAVSGAALVGALAVRRMADAMGWTEARRSDAAHGLNRVHAVQPSR